MQPEQFTVLSVDINKDGFSRGSHFRDQFTFIKELGTTQPQGFDLLDLEHLKLWQTSLGNHPGLSVSLVAYLSCIFPPTTENTDSKYSAIMQTKIRSTQGEEVIGHDKTPTTDHSLELARIRIKGVILQS